MRWLDPAKGGQTLLTGISCLAIGVASLGFAVWSANDDIRKNGRLDGDAITGLVIVGGAGVMFLVFGAVSTSGGLTARERVLSIRFATATDVPPESPGWKPPTVVTDHLDQPLGIDFDFFAAPPAEIGEVLSADTSLRLDDSGRPFVLNAIRATAVAAGAGSVVWLLMRLLEPNDSSARWIGASLAAWIGGLIGWGKSRFRHACYYVGRNGVARFVAAGDRGRIVAAEMFLFRDAVNVHARFTERRDGNVHRGVEYRFDWFDSNGDVAFQIAGAFFADDPGNNPWTDLPYQWGLAAMAAWRKRA